MLDIKKISYGECTFTKQLTDKLTAACLLRGRRLRELELPVLDELSAKWLIMFAIGIIVYGGLLSLDDFRSSLDDIRSHKMGLVYIYAIRIILGLNLSVFLWRVLLVLKYKSVRSCSNKELPKCTVIVPAYNEGRSVLLTLKSIVESIYPVNKLQIIAVDDGSEDDTFDWIETACRLMPGRIESVRLKKNCGKREALFEGIIRSKGRIIVTIDSDSIIEPQTLRRLLSPFVKDKSVGAVAGNVRVLNCTEGIIPRMLDVVFAFSFDFLRASQSMINTVFCTPGALSAYRKDVVMKNLNAWLNQTFLGTKANIGEDRAMTNMIINNGWTVKFQSNAIVYTTVPTTYIKLCKMFLRWARSNVRETLAMGKFIFKKFRSGSMNGARVNFVMSCMNLIVFKGIASVIIGFIFLKPQIYLSQLVFWAVVASTIPAVFYTVQRKNSDSLWAYVYGLFWLAGLWWITPWAILTARNGNWLTRQLPGERPIMPGKKVLRFEMGTAA